MTQRLVIIPWQEYQTLKNNLIGGGKQDQVPTVKAKEEKEVNEPLKAIEIPLTKVDNLPNVESLKDIRIPYKDEDNTPAVILLDKTPPGLLATGWLNWE